MRLPGITMPDPSFIVPEMLPSPIWAWANEPKIKKRATAKDRIALVAIYFTFKYPFGDRRSARTKSTGGHIPHLPRDSSFAVS